MADSKVSDLTSATSIGGADVFYVVQSNTSKKVSANVLFNNISNPTLSGNITIGGTPQALSSPGIISLITPVTHLTVGGTDGELQLPPGSTGQTKILVMIGASGGTYNVNRNNVAGSANVTFNNVGDTATMLYTNSKWYVIGGTANVAY
jgi:hypothetical protein